MQRSRNWTVLVGSIGLLVTIRFVEYLTFDRLGVTDGSLNYPILTIGFGIAQGLILACLSMIICLASLEIVMIVMEPFVFRGLYQYDPDLGFKVRPGVNESNRFGFNDIAYPLVKPEGMPRIASM